MYCHVLEFKECLRCKIPAGWRAQPEPAQARYGSEGDVAGVRCQPRSCFDACCAMEREEVFQCALRRHAKVRTGAHPSVSFGASSLSVLRRFARFVRTGVYLGGQAIWSQPVILQTLQKIFSGGPLSRIYARSSLFLHSVYKRVGVGPSSALQVQAAGGLRKAICDPVLIPDAILQDQVAETVSATSMLCAQVVSWVSGASREWPNTSSLQGSMSLGFTT